jgi:hypothetical protein
VCFFQVIVGVLATTVWRRALIVKIATAVPRTDALQVRDALNQWRHGFMPTPPLANRIENSLDAIFQLHAM